MRVEVPKPKLSHLPRRYGEALARTRRVSMKADARAAKRADRREAKRLVRALSSLVSSDRLGGGEWLSI